MNKKWLLYLLLTSSTYCFSQETNDWTYPTLPGTQEWSSLDNHQAKLDACQIPEDVLQSISTSKLIQLCLDYPLLMDIYAFNQISDGFNAFYSSFNGIQELVKRTDAIEELSASYRSKMTEQTSILNNKVTPVLIKGYYKLKVSAIEMFLGCPQMQSHLTPEQQKTIIALLMQGYEKKYESIDSFKGFGFHANVYARANIINDFDPSLFQYAGTSLLIKRVNQDIKAVEELNEISKRLISK